MKEKLFLPSLVVATTLIASSFGISNKVSAEVTEAPTKSDIVPAIVNSDAISVFTAGKWDSLGTDRIRVQTGNWHKTKIVHSRGGDFKAKFYGNSGKISVQLWESDGSTSSKVSNAKTVNASSGSITWRNIGKWVDGSNKKAEFFLKIKLVYGGGYQSVHFYD